MPTHPSKLTDTEARKISPPPSGYALHWCPRTPGFALRVTAKGARAWVIERRVNGKTTRRTLGAASGRGAISGDAARRLQVDVSSELQQGVDRLESRREERAAAKIEGETFGDALREYVKGKRRRKDGLALKARTKADYLAMLQPSRSWTTVSPRRPVNFIRSPTRPLARSAPRRSTRCTRRWRRAASAGRATACRCCARCCGITA